MSEVRQTSFHWYPKWQLDRNARILDPDGWDRDNWDASWNREKITYEEFCDRAMHCTIESYGAPTVPSLTAELTEAKRRIGELEAALNDEEKWYRRWAAWFHYHSGAPIQPWHTEGSWAEFLDGTLSMKPGIRNPARALLSNEKGGE